VGSGGETECGRLSVDKHLLCSGAAKKTRQMACARSKEGMESMPCTVMTVALRHTTWQIASHERVQLRAICP
jgi:hypothetical protein